MSWVDNIEAKARILHDQIAGMRVLAAEHGLDPEEASAPYYGLLRELYENDLPFARVLDSSDLVLRAEGPAADDESPRLKVLTDLFSGLRDQVGHISRALAGLGDSIPGKDIGVELGLTGLARGSVVLGVRLRRPGERASGEQQALPGYDEELFIATRSAVRQLAKVTRYLSDEGLDNDGLAQLVPDPATRDVILTAIHKLSPTGRKGVDKVTLTTSDDPANPIALTLKSRKMLASSLAEPVREETHGSFTGVVREIDLDARRFEIRKVKGPGALRVVYDPATVPRPKELLDVEVKVFGRIAKDARGRPRLMMMEKHEVLASSDDTPDLFEDGNA